MPKEADGLSMGIRCLNTFKSLAMSASVLNLYKVGILPFRGVMKKNKLKTVSCLDTMARGDREVSEIHK